VVLIGGGVALLLGLGLFQRLSASVEEKVGADDEAEEAAAEGNAKARGRR
jgi:hypothetical protein